MTHFDEIIFEQYFQYQNLTIDERNFLINLFLNSKDISDSEIRVNDNCPVKYDIDFLSLRKDGNIIKYEAIVSNKSETRMLHGFFRKHCNRYILYSEVYRCCDFIDDESKEYIVVDDFVFKNDNVYRRSNYCNGRYFEAEIELLNDIDLEEYIQSKTDEFKLKR